jgi:hypothetical protein
MDILNHFIDFMTCEMWWRTLLLGVSLEYSVGITCTLFFVARSNIESLFL